MTLPAAVRPLLLACLIALVSTGLPAHAADPGPGTDVGAGAGNATASQGVNRPDDLGPAAASITAFHKALLQTMKQGAALGCAGRRQRLAPVIAARFDLPFLAERVLRRHWQTLDADQRARFTRRFEQLVVSTYASQFARHDGERFETLAAKPPVRGQQQVQARLIPGSGNAVTFDYVLRETGGQWRIVNVIADGVSDLAVRASQYDKALRTLGFDGFLAEIDQQIAKAGC